MASKLTLKVYDVLDKEVATLVNKKEHAGIHHVQFDDSALASCVYFYFLSSNGQETSKKMLLMR